jgi:hypothetical protein
VSEERARESRPPEAVGKGEQRHIQSKYSAGERIRVIAGGGEGREAPVALYRLKDLIVDLSAGCLGRCGEDSDRLLESSSQIQVVPLDQILR